MLKPSVLVIFNGDLPQRREGWWRQFNTVVAPKRLEGEIRKYGITFVDLEGLVNSGSVQEASAFAEELSRLTLPDGSRLSKSFTYKGYELWWIQYSNLFLYFCLPYVRYKRLLEYLESFRKVTFCDPSHKNLFSCYLQANGCEINFLHPSGLKVRLFPPVGILLQIAITLMSLPILVLNKCGLMVFIGDKFEKSKDYDFRMKFVYRELRRRNLPFVEFIRSLEPWKVVLQHFFIRRRLAIYSNAVAYVGSFCSILFGGRRAAKRKFGPHTFASVTDPNVRFKLLVATQYLLGVYDDIWAIRFMKWILYAIGIKVSIIEIASGRSFHTVLGCKLNNIPTVGILHAVPSKYYTVHDFLPGFDGRQMLSVDSYGLWSDWWKEYYLKNSKAYSPEQLYVSGLMRPLEPSKENFVTNLRRESPGRIKVLFISEQLAVPHEIILYLEELLKDSSFDFAIKFRPYRDGFEKWLLENRPDLLRRENIKILRGDMQEALREHDVVIGSHSTAVLEAFLQSKIPIFFFTNKWGDYYDFSQSDELRPFYAETPEELIQRIKDSKNISGERLSMLREKYFGDPYRNGSASIVDKAEKLLKNSKTDFIFK